MKSNGMNFVLTVAIACSRDYGADPEITPDQAAAQIKEVLQIAFSNTGYRFDVQPLAYPISCKIPLIITINGAVHRLLWFYPQMTNATLAEELSGLMVDVPEPSLCATA